MVGFHKEEYAAFFVFVQPVGKFPIHNFRLYLLDNISSPFGSAIFLQLVGITTSELDTLKNWITKRMAWLDANIPGLCPPVGLTEAGAAVSVSCYPNPTNGDLNLAFVLTAETEVAIRIYNAAGAEVWSVARGMFGAGRHVVGLSALFSAIIFS